MRRGEVSCCREGIRKEKGSAGGGLVRAAVYCMLLHCSVS